MTKILILCSRDTQKDSSGCQTLSELSSDDSSCYVYKAFIKKKKKSVGIITDPQLAIFNLLLVLVQSILNTAMKYSGMLILGRKTCNLTWMAFLTQSFYSSSQTAPRRPRTQFLATQKFFVAPQQFLASRADQLFCQNQKNKSFKMSLDDWNKKNHFLKGKKKKQGGRVV